MDVLDLLGVGSVKSTIKFGTSFRVVHRFGGVRQMKIKSFVHRYSANRAEVVVIPLDWMNILLADDSSSKWFKGHRDQLYSSYQSH